MLFLSAKAAMPEPEAANRAGFICQLDHGLAVVQTDPGSSAER